MTYECLCGEYPDDCQGIRCEHKGERMPVWRKSRKKDPTVNDVTPEQSVQQTLIDALGWRKWLWWHIPKRSYRTKCQKCGHLNPPADINRGLADLIALGPPGRTRYPRLLWCEVKTQDGVVRPEQQQALDVLADMPQEIIRSGVCRPSDLDQWLRIIGGQE